MSLNHLELLKLESFEHGFCYKRNYYSLRLLTLN